MIRRTFALLVFCGFIQLAGCSSHPKTDLTAIRAGFIGTETRGLSLPFYEADVLAACDPPLGWKPDPLKTSPSHTHQVWASATGDSAYGVIHFELPLPIGLNLALSGFIKQMKTTEGDATLISKEYDAKKDAIRFVADGGPYRIRAVLTVAGWEGWAIYAGTLRNRPINQNELDLAERAREYTKVGRPADSGK
jgi:hypothetical protein